MTKKKPARHTRLLWLLLFLALVALTLYTVMSGSDDFSAERMLALLQNASPLWLIAAVLCMLGFVLFEGLSLRHLESFFGHKRPVRRNLIYSAADVYFSAITPSATGGQPASAVLMIRDGIPAAVTTMCLLVNVMLYTVAVLVIGLLCFLVKPALFLHFSLPSKLLILSGFCVQSLFVAGLLLLVLKEKIILKLAGWGLKLLHKLHLIKNIEKKQESLHRMAEEYRSCIRAFRGGKGVVARVLLLNLLQRLCNVGVTVCVFLAVGGAVSDAFIVLIVQGYVLLGAQAIPVPGAVGVTDYLFLDGFRELIPDTACVELLSRGISFYLCLLLCGGAVLLSSFLRALKNKRKQI